MTAILAISAALLAACSLAGDVTPPPGAQSSRASTPPANVTAAAPAPAEASLGYPSFKPSAAEGGVIFAQRCAACHGFSGKGDGSQSAELLTQRSQEPLPDFSTPDLARAATPAAWFQTITEGRLEKFMPPWADELSEAQRWNLVAFLYTLSTPQERMDSGKAVYDANCAECHGANGSGDGPKAESANPPPDFSDQQYMAAVSQSDFFKAVTDGFADGAHAYQTTLADDERWAAVDYVRAFAYEYAAPGAPLPETTGAIAGVVVNGTGGAEAPVGLEMILHGFDEFAEATTLTTTVGVSGTFQFGDVPYVPGRQFIFTTVYQGVLYGSDLISFDAGLAPEATVIIYESTPDPANVRVERMHVFFEFAGGSVTVGELFLLANAGDRTVANEDAPVIEFPLPAEAANITMQEGQEGVDFVRTERGIAVAAPIRPGPNAAQILVSFRLPYDRQLDFEQSVAYPVNVLNVLMPDVGVTLTGGELQDAGAQEIQGAVYRTYNASGLAAGETISFRLSGEAASGASGAVTTSSPLGLGIGLGAVALVLVGAGAWLYLRSRSTGEAPETREDLLQAIAELDDDFEAGEIAEGEYRRERAALKDRLKKLWE